MKTTTNFAVISLFSLTIALVASSALADESLEAGKSKSAMCAGCHGVNGISSNDLWPNLAGQKKAYLAKQITAFRDGSRSDPMMSAMAKSLSDQDINNLASYYSSLK